MIPIKSKEELEKLRGSGKILAKILKQLEATVRAGISTEEIDRLAERLVFEEHALPAFKGYRGFPASICTSINEEIVHGIPGRRRLNPGDILSIDLGVNYEGYFCDAAITVGVGDIDADTKRLIAVARQALYQGIEKARPNNRLYDISHAIQEHVEKDGFAVVRQFVGHGIGVDLHEEPEIPNFGLPHKGTLLKEGMVLAIEPMVNMGTWECEIEKNGWTAITKDRLFSAHFEHTVAITEDGPEILTG
ncbi:MAG: type I methionyl aminopeptidase [Candidatus Omnitrophota bacterium]